MEVGEDICDKYVIVGKDLGVWRGDLVSYVEWGKCGTVKHVGQRKRGVLGTVLTRQWVEIRANM